MDKNLQILLEIINSAIKTLNKNGYKIYDNENSNEDFYITEIKYNDTKDELVFNTDYEN